MPEPFGEVRQLHAQSGARRGIRGLMKVNSLFDFAHNALDLSLTHSMRLPVPLSASPFLLAFKSACVTRSTHSQSTARFLRNPFILYLLVLITMGASRILTKYICAKRQLSKREREEKETVSRGELNEWGMFSFFSAFERRGTRIRRGR